MAKKNVDQDTPDQDTPEVAEMTAADAAKCVCREIPILNEQGKPTGKDKQIAVSAKEVLSFRDCGDSVVVVTTDGQKLTGVKGGK